MNGRVARQLADRDALGVFNSPATVSLAASPLLRVTTCEVARCGPAELAA